MTFIKRGLGRGLEVLLADVSSKVGMEQTKVASNDTTDDLMFAQEQIEWLQMQNKALLSEAEQAKKMLEEIEAILRGDLD